MELANRITKIIAAVLCGAAVAPAALAADYPTKPIRIVVPVPPGGPMDLVARLYADYLQKDLKTTAVVENRPGAGIAGIIFTRTAVPDGHNLLIASVGFTASVYIIKDLPYDPIKDFAPISRLTETVAYMFVNAAVPANTVEEFVRYAKANPGKLNHGYAGGGLLWALTFFKISGIPASSLTGVPYTGGAQAMPALAAGDVQLIFDHCTAGPCKMNLDAGKVRMLAAGSAQRVPQFPAIPTTQESGLPGFTAVSWQGLFAPAGTPPEIVEKLAASSSAMLKQPDIRNRLVSGLGMTPIGSTPAEFRRFLEDEIKRFKEVADYAGLKPQ